MYIFNTTFAIEEKNVDKWIKYAHNIYVPELLEYGFTEPRIMRICAKPEQGYINYAIQFMAATEEFIQKWRENEMPTYEQEMRKLFKSTGVLHFCTTMEVIY